MQGIGIACVVILVVIYFAIAWLNIWHKDDEEND